MRFSFFLSRRNTEGFDLEEAMMDQGGNTFEVLEFPLSPRIFQAFFAAVLLVGSVILGRVVYLGVVQGNFYRVRALANVNREAILPAPRGIIFDRFGKPLVENHSTFDVYVRVSDFLQHRKAIESELKDVLNLSEEDIATLIHKADLEKSDLVLVAHDIESAQVIALKNRGTEGISAQNSYRRSYLFGPYFSHIVGYVDADRSTKTGFESFYDETLKGEDGVLLKRRNAQGEVVDSFVAKAAENGKALTIAIDSGLQTYLTDRLHAMLAAIDRSAGVGIALDPKNGEVLAMVSLPNFDNNFFASKGYNEEKRRILTSGSQPLFNRAISGLYSPGSTIKPLVAVAALKERVVDTQKSILSIGYIEIPNPYHPESPSRFLDWKPHGWVNLYSALARSSDVYFYEIGGGFEEVRGLGIQKLKEWWKKFLLGEKTGIDLPNERTAFLPDPEEKQRRTGQPWRIGDTYNVSIGQGDLLVTPIGLINYIAAIANQGIFFKPHFNKDEKPEILSDLTSLSPEIKEVQQGMRDAVSKPYGTAHMLADLPFASAGKTGSAQIQNNTKTNAFFVGYMPADNPELALLILVEDAKEGSLNAVPVAHDVFSWYYEHRIAK